MSSLVADLISTARSIKSGTGLLTIFTALHIFLVIHDDMQDVDTLKFCTTHSITSSRIKDTPQYFSTNKVDSTIHRDRQIIDIFCPKRFLFRGFVVEYSVETPVQYHNVIQSILKWVHLLCRHIFLYPHTCWRLFSSLIQPVWRAFPTSPLPKKCISPTERRLESTSLM